MEKFEILCLLKAISNYAYDIHYSAKGRFFYSDHIFSERLADMDVEDDLIETMYLGESQDAPSSTEINTRVNEYTPEISGNTDTDFKRLREMIISALMGIEQYQPKTRAEDDILGSIAHILQRHNGLLFRQLRYDAKENANDEDIKEWITVRGNHIPVMKGQTKEEAVKGFIEKKKGGDTKDKSQDRFDSEPKHDGVFTYRGNRIYVEKGQTKEEALREFIEQKMGGSKSFVGRNVWVRDKGDSWKVYVLQDKGDKLYVRDEDGHQGWVSESRLEGLAGNKGGDSKSEPFEMMTDDEFKKMFGKTPKEFERAHPMEADQIVWEKDGLGEKVTMTSGKKKIVVRKSGEVRWYLDGKLMSEMNQKLKEDEVAKFIRHGVEKGFQVESSDSEGKKKINSDGKWHDWDDVEWITVKGNHIPVVKGESKAEAIEAFFKSKGEEGAKRQESIKQIMGRASKAEKTITPDIKSVTESTGGKNIGLNFRLKEEHSAIRKLGEVYEELGEEVDEGYGLDSMWDLVRYTTAFKKDELKEKSEKVLADMEKKGYKIYSIKNSWNNDKNPYKGVNVKMVSPDGQKFELQFHTEKNFKVKEQQHKIYEKYRVEKNEKQKAEYERQMWEIGKGYEKPDGIEGLVMKDEENPDPYVKLIEKVKSYNGKPEGTYDYKTGERKEYPKGYSVSFHQNEPDKGGKWKSQFGRYTPEEYDKLTNGIAEMYKAEVGIGVYEDVPEITFHVDDFKDAFKIMKEYNQKSIWDWRTMQEIPNPHYNPKQNPMKGGANG